jgi:hypothetical protein
MLSKKSGIKAMQKQSANTNANTRRLMIAVNIIGGIVRTMLNVSMKRIVSRISAIAHGTMNGGAHCSVNTLKSIGLVLLLISTFGSGKLFGLNHAPLVESNASRMAITLTIPVLSMSYGCAGNVIQLCTGASVTNLPEHQKEYNQLTVLPAAGGFMGEGAVTPTYNSTYARKSVQLKVLRRKGAVTNFLQDASKNYIDAAAAEMENHLQAHVYDMIAGLEWGNADANAYAWDGLDKLIATNRTNNARGGVVPANLTFLDDAIDANLEKQGGQHKKVILASPKMQSLVSRLLTNVRLNQDHGPGLGTVEIEGGWRLASYRDIPILPVSGMSPKAKMGTVTASTATSGGTIADGTYWFNVAYVDYNGESEASTEISQICTGGAGNVHTLTLAWSAVTGALYYKVYVSTTTGTELLKVVLPAVTYDSAGTIAANVTGCVFTTTPSTANPTLTLSATSGLTTGPTASVPTSMQLDVPLISTGGIRPESVILWDLDKYQGLGKVPYTNSAGDRFNGLVTMVPLAVTDDNIPFLIRSYLALCPSFEASSVMVRNLRVS